MSIDKESNNRKFCSYVRDNCKSKLPHGFCSNVVKNGKKAMEARIFYVKAVENSLFMSTYIGLTLSGNA